MAHTVCGAKLLIPINKHKFMALLLRKNTNTIPHVGAHSERSLSFAFRAYKPSCCRAHQQRPNRKAFHSFQCTFYRSSNLREQAF
jgi:hypothetical protein